jgi:hypothetical protein
LQEHKDKEKLEGVIRSRKPKDTQYNGKNIKTKKFEGVIRSRKSKDTQYNGKNIKTRKV